MHTGREIKIQEEEVEEESVCKPKSLICVCVCVRMLSADALVSKHNALMVFFAAAHSCKKSKVIVDGAERARGTPRKTQK